MDSSVYLYSPFPINKPNLIAEVQRDLKDVLPYGIARDAHAKESQEASNLDEWNILAFNFPLGQCTVRSLL